MTEAINLIVPPHWSHLKASSLRGTIMVIGASDTGKSTLVRYLFQQSCRSGARPAYLDGGVGQSTLGLPTTMTAALAAGLGDDRCPPGGPRAADFVGATTLRGQMLPTVIGAYPLREKALALVVGARRRLAPMGGSGHSSHIRSGQGCSPACPSRACASVRNLL